MGVRGLTTFIANRSHLYHQEYELHDTYLIIDGNSLCAQLYKWHCNCYDCFGGDYDKYARVITQFFKLLFRCKVTPVVVFDGGYQKQKLKTVRDRMKGKLKSSHSLNSITEGSISHFPLFLREVFKDVVLGLNVLCARCDFEADGEIALLAKSLNCPVLSYDSDFYIFDVLYIPFSTFDMNCYTRVIKKTNKEVNYIKCQLYNIDDFLNAYGGMDKANLPILAVLLGNDYIKSREFSSFFSHLKMQKGKTASEQQRKIKTVILWLQHETFDTALAKILSRFKANRRKLLIYKIKKAIKAYSPPSSEIAKVLNLELSPQKISGDFYLNNIETISDETETLSGNETEPESSSNNSEDSAESEADSVHDFEVSQEESPNLPPHFVDKFRKCIYPSCFMDILTLNTYYFTPQVESNSEPNAHRISLGILSGIHKILTSSVTEKLVYYDRSTHFRVKKNELDLYIDDLPSLKQIESLTNKEALQAFMKILKIDHLFIDQCVTNFPESWHLLLITLYYWVHNSTVESCYVYAIVLSSLILFYVDDKIGYFRSSKSFLSKYAAKITNIKSAIKNEQPNTESNIAPLNDVNIAIKNINTNDSIICMSHLINYFQIDKKVRANIKLYDKNVVHCLSEFQSCFLHISYLNILLNSPFKHTSVSEFYNGTFIYNLVTNFKKRTDLDSYIKLFLANCPSVLNAFENIVYHVKKYAELMCQTNVKKRRRRKKNKKENDRKEDQSVSSEEEEMLHDENNRFSILLTL